MIYDLPAIVITANPSDFHPENTNKNTNTNKKNSEKILLNGPKNHPTQDLNSRQDISNNLSNNLSNTIFFKTSLSSLQAQNSAHITNMGIGQTISLRGFGDNAPSDILIKYNGKVARLSELDFDFQYAYNLIKQECRYGHKIKYKKIFFLYTKKLFSSIPAKAE